MTNEERKLLALLILTFVHETGRIARKGIQAEDMLTGLTVVYSMSPDTQIFYEELQGLVQEFSIQEDQETGEYYITLFGVFLFEHLSPIVPPPKNHGRQLMLDKKPAK